LIVKHRCRFKLSQSHVSAVGLQAPPHAKTQTKSRLHRSGYAEAAGFVEAFRMGVANNVQKSSRSHPSDFGSVLDKSPSDALLPEVRLDEERVQLRTIVGTRHHSGKTDDDTIAFCHEDAARRDLLNRQRNRVRIRKQRVAIAGIAERRTPL